MLYNNLNPKYSTRDADLVLNTQSLYAWTF